MLLVDRVKSSVAKRHGTIVLRADLEHLGSPSQISLALTHLIADGVLIRLGEGIYAKTRRDEQGKIKPAGAAEPLVHEILLKLGIDPNNSCTEEQGGQTRVIVDEPARRVSRHLVLDTGPVEIVSPSALKKNHTVPSDPKGLPRRNVGKYIAVIARMHHVSPERTGLDQWAEAVSRAAGDTVQLDDVGRLLAKLKQQQVITGKQMAHLMNNYVTERHEANAHV
ncbi:type IV toxin-antitoxin system AbiEi family antitoxin domain-containing protein [Achromobacter sp. DH1f]|uniref:type IV toxin-antitoxin system AbiEi family antitoxin domain-containing protein n=1 Tax=Achromobacter sp. DH1f TaxID=1397275 RepID=UPI000469179B|nr:type IV toxin-antitoxin system AbiEi family antitoxin domain-containing protein [Achromobacter sp. DH1f]